MCTFFVFRGSVGELDVYFKFACDLLHLMALGTHHSAVILLWDDALDRHLCILQRQWPRWTFIGHYVRPSHMIHAVVALDTSFCINLVLTDYSIPFLFKGCHQLNNNNDIYAKPYPPYVQTSKYMFVNQRHSCVMMNIQFRNVCRRKHLLYHNVSHLKLINKNKTWYIAFF